MSSSQIKSQQTLNDYVDQKTGYVFEKSAEQIVAKEQSAMSQIKAFKPFPYLKESCVFYSKNLKALKVEVMSGLTVAIMQIPESVAFSFVAGVDPISGLYSTFFLGFITAAIGGKPGMISGAAGALAVVVKNMMADEGPLKDYNKDEKFHHLMMTMVLCGILQTLCGLVQIAKLVKLIPYSAMIGFMNGLGIIIFLSQMQAFTECNGGKDKFSSCKEKEREWIPIDAGRTWSILFLTFLTMFIMQFYPKIPKIGKLLPGSFVAIVAGTLIEHLITRPLIDVEARTVGETTGIKGEVPTWLPPEEPSSGFEWATIIQYAVSLCFIGLIESVMTLQYIEELTNSVPSQFKANQECVAQGISNLVSGLFGAMGGDAMIGQSTINVKINKAKGRLSGMIAGISILIIIIVAYTVIDLIPIATLTGVLFMVVLNTFNWSSLTIIARREVPIFDIIVILLVTILAVTNDLAVAVAVGVVFISIVSNYNSSNEFKIKVYHIKNNKYLKDNQQQAEDNQNAEDKSIKVYQVEGHMQYSSICNLHSLLDYQGDDNIVVLDVENTSVGDISVLEDLNKISIKYRDLGKRFYLANVKGETQLKIKNSSYYTEFIKVVPDSYQGDFAKLFNKEEKQD